MKAKYELVCHSHQGVVWSYYICKIKKHWWSKWETVMNGDRPQKYDKINNQYVARCYESTRENLPPSR